MREALNYGDRVMLPDNDTGCCVTGTVKGFDSNGIPQVLFDVPGFPNPEPISKQFLWPYREPRTGVIR